MLPVTSIESCVVCSECRNLVLCGKGSDLMVCVLRLKSCVTCCMVHQIYHSVVPKSCTVFVLGYCFLKINLLID